MALKVVTTTAVDAADVEPLWRGYAEAFAALADEAAARMVLHRWEFDAQMTDPNIDKTIAWDENAVAGMTALATDLAAVPWVSRAFWARQRRPVYYLAWTFVRPEYRGAGLAGALLTPAAQRALDDGAVVGYDTCRSNDERGFTEGIGRAMAALGVAPPQLVDEQRYYLWRYPGDEEGAVSDAGSGGS